MLEVNKGLNPSSLIVVGLSFIITFLLIPLIIKATERFSYINKPLLNNSDIQIRSTLGGLAIFFGSLVSIVFSLDNIEDGQTLNLYTTSFIVLLVGLTKDTLKLNTYQKLIGQVAAAMIIIAVCDIRFTSLYNLFGITEVPIAVSYLLSLFTVIVITNAYNLIDGIDGLSGSVGIISTLFFGIYFYLNEQIGFALIALSLCGALLAFLNYNWAPSKIFMGDTGSLFIGFFLSILAIRFIDFNHTNAGSEFAFGGSIGTAVAVLILPLADTFRVFVKRVLRGKSPMHPDRTHVHHILLRLGCNHAQATGILVTVNIIFVLLALVLKDFSDAVVIPSILVTVIALGTILDLIFKSAIEKRKEELRERNRASREEAKVISIRNSG